MPNVPAHRVVRRLSPSDTLAVNQQGTQDLGDSCILIKMSAAAVCGTDLAMLSGNRPCRAQVLGHEGVGIVLYAPEGSTVEKGARVIINPVHRKYPEMVIGHTCDGVFREFFCLQNADAMEGNLLVSCPSECLLGDVELVLAEPLASVLYSLELLRKRQPVASLLIRGSGTVGILAAKLWTSLTNSSAIVVSNSAAHVRWLRAAMRWPANVRICCSNELSGVIREHCSGGVDAAILCCSRESASEGLCRLLDVIEEGATIDLMAGFPVEYREARLGGINLDAIRWSNICGIQSSPPSEVVDRASGKTIYLVGHRGTAERHIHQAIEVLSRKLISIADIPHRRLTLEELPGAVSKMLSSEGRHSTRWIKTIVTFAEQARGEPVAAC